MKKLISLVLSLVMVLSILPTTAFAEDTTPENDGVEFTKTLIQGVDGQPDRIKLEAWTTGKGYTSTVHTPTDIIIVTDQSGSMVDDNKIGDKTKLQVMEEAIAAFVAEVANFNAASGKDDTYRLALVGFASDEGYGNNTEVLTLESSEDIVEYSYEEIARNDMVKGQTYYVRNTQGPGYRQVEWSDRHDEWRVYGGGGNNGRELQNNETVYERIETVTGTNTITGVPYYDLFTDDDYTTFNSTLLSGALVNVNATTTASTGTIGKAVDALDAEGATRVDLGLEIAAAIFDAQPTGTYTDADGNRVRDQLVMVITDGVPTTGTQFSDTVANDAVEAALGIKNDGAHVYSMYIGTPSTASANFLQAVSSNYPKASSITVLGTKAADSYYSAHTDAAEITKVFEDIAYSVAADSPLDETSVISDTISAYFRLTDGAVQGDQIKVYTVDKTKDGWADEEVEFPTASVTLKDNNKTVEVTGFNFSYHCVVEEPKDGTNGTDYGKKLVIYIPITEDTEYCETNSFGGYLITNAGAFITDSDLSLPITATSAMDDATIRYSLEAAERVHHLGTDTTYTTTLAKFLTQDMSSTGDDGISVLQEAITNLPDGTKNAGVDMTYYIIDPGTTAVDPYDPTSTNDDKVIATLSVPAGESVDPTDFSKWTLADGADAEVKLTIDSNNLAEKVLILACRLTSANDTVAETKRNSLLVYSNLDLIVTNEDGYVVYGEIDANGTLTVPANAAGTLFGNTYTEVLVKDGDSETMTFTPNEGYVITHILKLTKDGDGNDVRKDLYTGGTSLIDPVDGDEALVNGVFTAKVSNIATDTAYEVTTAPKTFTLTTEHDTGSTIRHGTTYTYHSTEYLDVWFNNVEGYHITSLTVDGVEYTAAELLAMTDTTLAALGITLTTADSYEADGDSIKVITAGSVAITKTDDHDVKVTSAKQTYKLTYIYYEQNSDGSYTSLDTMTESYYVTYGDPITSDSPKHPVYRAGDVKLIDEANHTLSQWYDRYETTTKEFLDVVTIASATMPAHDYDLNAFWSKNPDKALTGVTLLKTLDAKQTEDWTFNFIAVFDGKTVWTDSITFAAGESEKEITLEAILTDIQYNKFKAGDVINVYESHQDDANWNYDETVFTIGYEDGTDDGIVITDTALDSEVDYIYYFNKRQPIVEVDKTLTSGEDPEIGDTVTWTITVKNLTDKAQTFTLEDALTVGGKSVDAGKVTLTHVSGATENASTGTWTVPASGEAVFTAAYTILITDAGKALKNEAIVKVGEYTYSDNAPEVDINEGKSEFAVEKWVELINGEAPEKDEATGKYLVKVGDTVTYKIAVHNNGTAAGKITGLNDTLSIGDRNIELKVKNLDGSAAADSIDISYQATKLFLAEYTVTEQDRGEILVNTAKVDGGISGKDDTVKVKNPILSVTKDVNLTRAKAGDTLTYTITVKNIGDTILTNIKVEDEMTDGSWVIDKLDPNGSWSKETTYKVTKADEGKTLVNVVTAKADDGTGAEGISPETEIIVDIIVIPIKPNDPQLNTEDHYAYIVGYPDGKVYPNRNITRAEAATIFFRMLLDESREQYWAQTNNFTDVSAGQWYNNAISTLANAKVIGGYPDGSYKPNSDITRAEFATIAIRFFLNEDVEINENNLSDVKGHWAEANIDLAYALGLIEGYPDGTFRPDQLITRAEAMAIVNRVLKRSPDKDHLTEDMIKWPDNMDKSAWYYADVQEATNSHELRMEDKNAYEIWTKLLPVRDWVALEREWSKHNSSTNPGEIVDIYMLPPRSDDDE